MAHVSIEEPGKKFSLENLPDEEIPDERRLVIEVNPITTARVDTNRPTTSSRVEIEDD